jgi:hypothetical protein
LTTAAEREHLKFLHTFPCMVCASGFAASGGGQIEVHHPRDDQGAAQRASDWLGIPLCWGHHQGPHGIHGLGTRGFYTRYRLEESDLVALTVEMVVKRLRSRCAMRER